MQQLANYSFVTLDTTRRHSDLLKRLYQNLMPQELRHDLGNTTRLTGSPRNCSTTPRRDARPCLRSPDERLLDPTCGSGTFLVLHIRDIRLHARDVLLPQRKITRRQLLDKILANVVGYDLNPSPSSARTNYLLALGDLLDQVEGRLTSRSISLTPCSPPRRARSSTNRAKCSS